MNRASISCNYVETQSTLMARERLLCITKWVQNVQCNTYLQRTKVTFQTLEYILNVIIHAANITAARWYKLRCHCTVRWYTNYVKLWLRTMAEWQRQDQRCFSFANCSHDAFHTLIFSYRVGKQAQNIHNAKLNSSPRCMHIAHTHKTGNQTNTKRCWVWCVKLS